MKTFIDGTFYDNDKAVIPVFDHGLLYGDGVFEGIRIYNGRIFKLVNHLQRLYASAAAINLNVGMTNEVMEDAVIKTVSLSNKKDGYIRILVTRGDGSLGLDPYSCKKARVIIIVDDITLYPRQCYTDGIRIITSSYRRIPSECFDVQIKSLNYLNNILAKIEARKAGCLECVMLNTAGRVAECTADNLFIVTKGCLYTPPPSEGALEGITRQAVFEIARSLQIEYKEKMITRYDLYSAEECFLSGTAAEVVPVIEIDGRCIGSSKPGPVTMKIIESFSHISRSNECLPLL